MKTASFFCEKRIEKCTSNYRKFDMKSIWNSEENDEEKQAKKGVFKGVERGRKIGWTTDFEEG